MPTLAVYNLGEKGVNLTKSKVHHEDGELERGQNAIIEGDQREGALRVRPGLAKVNGSALAGSVRGVIASPFGAPTTQKMYAAIDDSTLGSNSNTWRTSSDGSTWANDTDLVRGAEIDEFDDAGFSSFINVIYAVRGAASLNGRIYYAADGDFHNSGGLPVDVPTLRSWDGTTDIEVFKVPPPEDFTIGSGDSQFITDLLAVGDDTLYIGTVALNGNVNAASFGVVFQYVPSTGVITKVADTINSSTVGTPMTMAWFQGKLWVVTSGSAATAGVIRWAVPPGIPIDPPGGAEGPASQLWTEGSATWTTDLTQAGAALSGLAVYKGLLYTGLVGSSPAAKVLVRSNLGAWTTSDTDPDGTSNNNSNYTHFIVYEDELYAALIHNDASQQLKIRKFDGSSWTTDYDVLGNQADVRNVGAALVFGGKLYWVIGGLSATDSLILENDSGAWSEVETGIAFRGYIATLEVGSGI